jgi:hypothetical protein
MSDDHDVEPTEEPPPPTITAIDVYHQRKQAQLEAGRKAVERQRAAERQRRMAWNQVTDALRHLAQENYDEAKACLNAALTFLAAADHTDKSNTNPE